MKKLNKEITAAFYRDAEGYAALQAHWSCLMRDETRRHSLTAAHFLLYLILRGRNWQHAFAPMTNPRKLENGGFYNWGARRALRALHSEWEEERLLKPFAAFVRSDALCLIREWVPPLRWDEDPLEREPYHG